ncbi:interferon-induced, double-stranded RNA-activated protein kinase isoform X2 [Ciconia boyciana]|uniref:interferon-induced, double-stranded RNA-activated protein kinase isoform X2 n=1 Tax=Ciconia boyciana TaxID=52775 RepID=UPI003BA20F46
MERESMEKVNNYCQKQKSTLVYANIRMTGPPHDPEFTVVVKIDDVEYGRGTGKNKKEAKAVAAKKTWEMIEKKMESEKSNGNSTFREHSNFSQLSTQPNLDNNCFEDSRAKLAEKMKDMACEKPSPAQRNAQSPALKPQRRQLAANFANLRNKEEEKKMSNSDESLPDLDTNSSEENESPHTVDKRFLESFKNIEPIGKGGFGNVFKATAKLDERTYAVKRVRFTMNVKREVKELARLDHENIVRYYCSWKGQDYVTYPDSRQKSEKEMPCLFIQMELCEQGPLGNWIEKNRQDRKYQEMVQNKFLQILKGVEYIHSKGLIHRDLKPQNIFISHEDKIKIGDFGLVTSVECETLTGDRGTRLYMAPEQFGTKYGKEVDIYALGLIWLEMLSAFSSCHEKSKLWHDVREGKLLESFTNQFPTEAPMIKKMLSRDPSGRYSASEILKFLMSVDKDNSLKNHTR